MTEQTTEREQRYTEAIRGASSLYGEYDEGDQVERVMAVADAEQDELRAEIERLTGLVSLWMDRTQRAVDRAEAAEAKVARVEAVANDEFGFTYDAIRAALDGDS